MSKDLEEARSTSCFFGAEAHKEPKMVQVVLVLYLDFTTCFFPLNERDLLLYILLLPGERC